MKIKSPKWEDVSAAIRKMDDYEYPIVLLSWKDVGGCFHDDSKTKMSVNADRRRRLKVVERE